MQDKARLGTRYTCFNCGTKFYDLNRPQPTCPRCGADQNDNPAPDPRVAVLSRYKGSSTPARLSSAPALDDLRDDEVEETTEEVGIGPELDDEDDAFDVED